MMKWFTLVLSSGFEIGWAVGLKYADTPPEWILTFLCIIGSSFFLVIATRMLPVSVAYIAFVVFGTVGTYLVDIIAFNKNMSIISVFSICLMLYSIFMLERCK